MWLKYEWAPVKLGAGKQIWDNGRWCEMVRDNQVELSVEAHQPIVRHVMMDYCAAFISSASAQWMHWTSIKIQAITCFTKKCGKSTVTDKHSETGLQQYAAMFWFDSKSGTCICEIIQPYHVRWLVSRAVWVKPWTCVFRLSHVLRGLRVDNTTLCLPHRLQVYPCAWSFTWLIQNR